MKLTVEALDHIRAVFADGVMLPQQRKLTIVSECDEPTVLIVEFVVDSKRLRIVGDPNPTDV